MKDIIDEKNGRIVAVCVNVTIGTGGLLFVWGSSLFGWGGLRGIVRCFVCECWGGCCCILRTGWWLFDWCRMHAGALANGEGFRNIVFNGMAIGNASQCDFVVVMLLVILHGYGEGNMGEV